MPNKKNIVRKSNEKANHVYETLRDKIIYNELKQGELLIERALCSDYEWSRTPVREALRLLSNEGLVNYVPGHSSYVSYITFETISDLYDIREVLEGLSARLCAENIGKNSFGVLEEIFERFKSEMLGEHYPEALKLDIEIHHFLIQESRNAKLKALLTPLFNQSKRIVNLTVYTNEWARESFDFHMRIFEAIRDKKPQVAEETMREHIRMSKRHQIENLHRYKSPNN
jgi:DNA-binding GntR family transcriptional regulator